ncbi:hypothetical protein EYF80_060152 [Liparis tanakae]|uniref:Uncharacterized protein n=1 Tax=Liparis tanakae TaxID=230148 RepID=A0A4Z2ELM6_9TELE|nr:hypothetical protein EYF80_060152 [Liparis tanakae]
MQEEALYFQAGSEPGGPSNRAANPKGAGRTLKSGQQVNRVVTGRSELGLMNSLESSGTTHKTIWQRTRGSEGAEE